MLVLTRQDRVINKLVLEQAGIPSWFALLSQRQVRWLNHVICMEDIRIPKHVLYSELDGTGTRPVGKAALHTKTSTNVT